MGSFAVLNASIAYLLYRKDFFLALIIAAFMATCLNFMPFLIVEPLLRCCLLVGWMLMCAIVVVQELQKDQVISLQQGFWRMIAALKKAPWFLGLSLIITFCLAIALYMPTPSQENVGVMLTFVSLLFRALQSFFNILLLPMIALGSYNFYPTMQRASVLVYRHFFSLASLLVTFLIVALIVYAIAGFVNFVIVLILDKFPLTCSIKHVVNVFIFQIGLFFVYTLLAIAQVHYYLSFIHE